MIASVPIGASGQALKLYWPNNSAYVEQHGLILDCRSRFTWMLTWLIVRHHRCTGKCLSAQCRQEVR